MTERHSARVHPESVVLDIGRDVGALIVYTEPGLAGEEIEISPRESVQDRSHVEVLERRINDQPVFAAVFFGLRAGRYDLWNGAATPSASVTIIGGEVATLDWRQSP